MMTAGGAAEEARDRPSPEGSIDFTFLPKALVERCKPPIIRYYELTGFSSLPDIWWHPEIHQFIETDLTLKQLFNKSTTSRGAKEANEGLVIIAHSHSVHEILATRRCWY
jgi:hypothetical protein